jgi:hypothetical protein
MLLFNIMAVVAAMLLLYAILYAIDQYFHKRRERRMRDDSWSISICPKVQS